MKKLKASLFIPPILLSILKRAQSLLRTSYKIGDITISIPRHIDLPNVQKSHPLYDRFLPVLCKHLTGPKTIVDVGANIGDTAVAMAQHCSNPILCIEPSPHFYPYLTKNLELLPTGERFKALQTMIGTGKFAGELDHSKGTARLVLDSSHNAIPFVALDSLKDTIRDSILIKSDTDGFDFDVLLSAKSLIEKDHPILYWENEIQGPVQLHGFLLLYEMLQQEGYDHIHVFDNFGNLLLEGATVRDLVSLNEYLHSMRSFNQTRTFYYVDILATTNSHVSVVNAALEEYKKMIQK